MKGNLQQHLGLDASAPKVREEHREVRGVAKGMERSEGGNRREVRGLAEGTKRAPKGAVRGAKGTPGTSFRARNANDPEMANKSGRRSSPGHRVSRIRGVGSGRLAVGVRSFSSLGHSSSMGKVGRDTVKARARAKGADTGKTGARKGAAGGSCKGRAGEGEAGDTGRRGVRKEAGGESGNAGAGEDVGSGKAGRREGAGESGTRRMQIGDGAQEKQDVGEEGLRNRTLSSVSRNGGHISNGIEGGHISSKVEGHISNRRGCHMISDGWDGDGSPATESLLASNSTSSTGSSANCNSHGRLDGGDGGLDGGDGGLDGGDDAQCHAECVPRVQKGKRGGRGAHEFPDDVFHEDPNDSFQDASDDISREKGCPHDDGCPGKCSSGKCSSGKCSSEKCSSGKQLGRVMSKAQSSRDRDFYGIGLARYDSGKSLTRTSRDGGFHVAGTTGYETEEELGSSPSCFPRLLAGSSPAPRESSPSRREAMGNRGRVVGDREIVRGDCDRGIRDRDRVVGDRERVMGERGGACPAPRAAIERAVELFSDAAGRESVGSSPLIRMFGSLNNKACDREVKNSLIRTQSMITTKRADVGRSTLHALHADVGGVGEPEGRILGTPNDVIIGTWRSMNLQTMQSADKVGCRTCRRTGEGGDGGGGVPVVGEGKYMILQTTRSRLCYGDLMQNSADDDGLSSAGSGTRDVGLSRNDFTEEAESRMGMQPSMSLALAPQGAQEKTPPLAAEDAAARNDRTGVWATRGVLEMTEKEPPLVGATSVDALQVSSYGMGEDDVRRRSRATSSLGESGNRSTLGGAKRGLGNERKGGAGSGSTRKCMSQKLSALAPQKGDASPGFSTRECMSQRGDTLALQMGGAEPDGVLEGASEAGGASAALVKSVSEWGALGKQSNPPGSLGNILQKEVESRQKKEAESEWKQEVEGRNQREQNHQSGRKAKSSKDWELHSGRQSVSSRRTYAGNAPYILKKNIGSFRVSEIRLMSSEGNVGDSFRRAREEIGKFVGAVGVLPGGHNSEKESDFMGKPRTTQRPRRAAPRSRTLRKTRTLIHSGSDGNRVSLGTATLSVETKGKPKRATMQRQGKPKKHVEVKKQARNGTSSNAEMDASSTSRRRIVFNGVSQNHLWKAQISTLSKSLLDT